MHGDRARAAAETYIGLVEVGVGVIPAGGGTKEMTMRAMDAAMRAPDADPLRGFQPPVQEWFRGAFTAPTRAQALAWPLLLSGHVAGG